MITLRLIYMRPENTRSPSKAHNSLQEYDCISYERVWYRGDPASAFQPLFIAFNNLEECQNSEIWNFVFAKYTVTVVCIKVNKN